MADMLALASQTWLPMVVGTYTTTDSEGIYTCRFNQETGETEMVGIISATNPSFVTCNPENRCLYAVNESGSADDSATAFRYDSIERIVRLNELLTSGAAPCNVASFSSLVITSNYTGGSLTVFRTSPDGSLDKAVQRIEFPLIGPAPDSIRQKSAHIHCAKPSPDGRFLFVSDLGNDCIHVFSVDTIAAIPLKQLRTVAVAAGSGPRHLEWSPDGQLLYVITELSGEIIVFRHSDGELTEAQTIVCDKERAAASADIHLSPDGRFLYASNRRINDGIRIFAVDQATGLLKNVGYQPTGIHPRNFAITPNGKFLLCACRDSNELQVFAIDSATGLLTDTRQPVTIPRPVCILFPFQN